jgi:hypothetical protein
MPIVGQKEEGLRQSGPTKGDNLENPSQMGLLTLMMKKSDLQICV